MRYILSLLLAFAIQANAQNMKPVQWTFSAEKKNNNEAELTFKAKIDEGWHVYSQYTPEGGPLPMYVTFDSSKCYTKVDSIVEPKPKTEYDSVFAVNVFYHEKEIIMKQKIKYAKEPCLIKGKLEYQACKSVCIPLDTIFTFSIGRPER